MKRINAIILSMIMFILSVIVPVVSAQAKEDIKFRDIPWESSIEDTLALLKKEFGNNIKYESKLKSMRLGEFDHTTLIAYYITIPNFKVAGFPASESKFDEKNNIILYFLPDFDKENATYSETKGKLIGAEYGYIHPENMSFESFSDELERKLTNIYGDPEKDYGEEWKNTWISGDTKLYGESVKTSEVVGTIGIAKVSTRVPTGISLVYCYESRSIIKEIDTNKEIEREKEQEKWEEEEAKKQKQKEEEENERGSDGL